MHSRTLSPTAKIIPWDRLQAWRKTIANSAGIPAIVTGTFALLHPGNLAAIHAAKRQGAHVLVIIQQDDPASPTNDGTIPALKEPSGAAIPGMAARLETVANLRDVAAVTTCAIGNAKAVFNWLQPYSLVDCIRQKQSGDIARIARNLAVHLTDLTPIAGCFAPDIREAIRNGQTPLSVPDSVLTLQPTCPDLDRFLNAPATPKPLVTVNGCFDILHLGHIRLLNQARDLGTRLLVLVNDDDSVRHYKGAKRPVFPVRFRLQALAALEPVSMAYPFAGDNPLSLLATIRPDIHVKGGSFEEARMQAEKHLVESWGGRLATIPMVEDYSTSKVVTQMAANRS